MGILNYGASARHLIEFDDRTLSHLQVVIGAKLRQRQPFFLSWLESADGGSGRGSIWIDAAIPLTFHYKSSQRFAINREWLEILMTSANSTVGLQLTLEPGEPLPPAATVKLVDHWRPADELVRS